MPAFNHSDWRPPADAWTRRDVMRNGIDSTLLGIGRRSIAELTPADLLIPAGFSPG